MSFESATRDTFRAIGADINALYARAEAVFTPKTNDTTDVGTTTLRFRDLFLSRHLRLGTLYLRDNAGVFEKSTNGTTWSVVDTTGGVLPDVDFLTDYNTALGG